MKFCKQNIFPEHIINILSINDTNWLTHIENSDVDYILDKATNIALQLVFGHNIKEAMLNLDLIEIDADKAKKALFLIRYNRIYKPFMFEISELSDRLTNLCPQADVLLGFASDCDIEYNVAITALTSY